jgi:hypothetical protein
VDTPALSNATTTVKNERVGKDFRVDVSSQCEMHRTEGCMAHHLDASCNIPGEFIVKRGTELDSNEKKKVEP